MPETTSSLRENLHFLLHEVDTHCHFLELFVKTGSIEVYPRIRARQGYLKALREKLALEFDRVLARRKPGTAFYSRITGYESLASALNQLAQCCFEAVQDGSIEGTLDLPSKTESRKLVQKVRKSLKLIELGIDENQTRAAIKLGRRTKRLLSNCEDAQKIVLASKDDLTGEQLNASVLCNAGIKRVIRSLIKVGEALISANLGQAVNLENYDKLRSVVSTLDYSLDDLKIQRLALTRSGSAIAGVKPRRGAKDQMMAVYKEGDRRKVEEEIAGFNVWHEVHPGLAPRVLAQTDQPEGPSAVLIEHLPGKTLEALLLEARSEMIDTALTKLFTTLDKLWKKSRTEERASADFMGQLGKRLPECASVHPEFFSDTQQICGYNRPGFKSLISRVAKREPQWRAPFSVLIHGDFNVDNLIFDAVENRIYFIDLHRSTYQDYVQDLSVLMVSIYRLRIIEGESRTLMMEAAKRIYRFGRRWSLKQQDPYFDLRLAAGLARSFSTSIRFIYDRELATRVHLRASYLLETLASLPPEKETEYKIPLEALFFE